MVQIDLMQEISFVGLGAVLGLAVMILVLMLVPMLVDRITPRINDEKEMLRGNIAVATYVGMVTQAIIIGISIVVAAAVIAGI